VISFYAPCSIMVLLYVKMWRAAKRLREATRLELLGNGYSIRRALKAKNGHQSRPFKRPESSLLSSSETALHPKHGEDKALKTLSVICGVFIVCWLPFFVIALAKSQYTTLRVPQWLHEFVIWLGYSNSMLNPMIYAFFNREFRIPFREMLCCRFSTIKNVMRNEEFTRNFGSPKTLIKRSVIELQNHNNGCNGCAAT